MLERLNDAGISADSVSLNMRERTVRKIEDIEVVRYVDHFDDPLTEARRGALGGVIGGAIAGATFIFLAMAGVAVFTQGVTNLFGTISLPVALAAIGAGAVGGAVAGGVIGALLGASDNDATKVRTTETQVRDVVENEGFVLTIELGTTGADDLAVLLQESGAEDVALLNQRGKHLRTHLE